MAISRSLMERQLRAGGGIITLEEPRQGYFLGKIVKKAKRAVKKITKSPLGKAAILAGLGAYAGGIGPFASGKFGAGFARPLFSGLKTGFLNPLMQGPMATRSGGIGRAIGSFIRNNPGKSALLGLGAAGIAAPFFMGGDDEEVEEETSFTETPDSIANIVEQARNRDPSLRFLPEPQFVRNFYRKAGGGIIDVPRGGYKEGESVLSKEQMAMISDMKDKGMDMSTIESMTGATADQITSYLSSLNQKAEGGIMDLGGMEKDYRTGGFVELGAEERADDVPARLSKNEFVFTADAVRNAGGGDIDEGARVMQNMMDNLEAGGMISEESQGMNPAQEMFDQAQMMEGRLA